MLYFLVSILFARLFYIPVLRVFKDIIIAQFVLPAWPCFSDCYMCVSMIVVSQG